MQKAMASGLPVLSGWVKRPTNRALGVAVRLREVTWKHVLGMIGLGRRARRAMPGVLEEVGV
jgi:hypothetical protein